MNEKEKHLPVIGIGPFYLVPIVLLTAASVMLSIKGIIPQFFLRNHLIHILFYAIGVFFIALGCILWVKAVLVNKIDVSIKRNKLFISGVYAYVRNPIYSAFFFSCSGALFLCGNVYGLVLPPLFYLYLTVLMKRTEEKWLHKLYGVEFENYCRRVNRCIPWIRK